MSKQDPGQIPSAPPPQYAYGAPLQQQYGSQPPPYSAMPSAQPYSNPAAQPAFTALSSSQAHAAYSQSPYVQQQYVPMPQIQQMPQGYVSAPASAYPRQQYMPMMQPQLAHQGPPPPYTSMIVPQPQTVIVGGAYDAGARFDGLSQPHVPPPPPGVIPNAAQMASMQGHTVVGTQQRSNWFTGGSGGGSTLF